MRVGYDRLLTMKETTEELTSKLLQGETDQVVIELYGTTEVFPESSRLTRLLDQCHVGDTLVVQRLERVSDSPFVWRELLGTLSKRQIELEILDSPSLTLNNWLEVMTWWQAPVKSSKSKSRIISIEKESEREYKKIRPLAKSATARELYWQLFKELQQGASLRRTAKRLGVSQGTVLRVKRDVAKLKQVVWLVLTFVITVVSLKIAQAYANHWFPQLLICGVATLAIIYFSYSDIKESE